LKEIGNEQKYRTLYDVFNGKRDPSSKLVKSIVKRFPQLSYDWVFVGAGEMLIEGADQLHSVASHEITVQARFEIVMQKIENIEHAANELANRIDRSMAHQAEMTNVFFKKIDDLTNSNQHLLKTDQDVKETMKMMTDVMYDNRERSASIAENYWKTSARIEKSGNVAEECLEKLNDITQKLSELGS
jgi:methyl-accepting chemotaxis protein